jgi:hypothetical protein
MKKMRAGIIIIVLLVIIFIVLLFLRGDEDTWIRNTKGEYVKHGNPYTIPETVKEYQNAVVCGQNLYNKTKEKGTEFNSQCLGTCGKYAIDIVNVPRCVDDERIENQCVDFRNGLVKNFIELDHNGTIVRVV